MIGDPELSAEDTAYRDEASRQIRALIPPDLPERMDRNEILYPKDYLRAMAKHHYLGVPVPPSSTEMMKLIIQEAAFERLRDPDFPASWVGNELGSP